MNLASTDFEVVGEMRKNKGHSARHGGRNAIAHNVPRTLLEGQPGRCGKGFFSLVLFIHRHFYCA